MNTKNFLFTCIFLSQIFTINAAAAPLDTLDQDTLAMANNTDVVLSSSEKVLESEKKKSVVGYQLISFDHSNSLLCLNTASKSFSYSTVLLIQDFNGRVLRTFKVNLMNPSVNSFYLNDLLPDVYYYTLINDNQERITGQFEVKE
jgi:hypothetical protein